jgi:alcohol dehydrogenase class IV
MIALGLGPETHDTIAQDSVDDAAIANSPRLPSKPEILEILAAVSG